MPGADEETAVQTSAVDATARATHRRDPADAHSAMACGVTPVRSRPASSSKARGALSAVQEPWAFGMLVGRDTRRSSSSIFSMAGTLAGLSTQGRVGNCTSGQSRKTNPIR